MASKGSSMQQMERAPCPSDVCKLREAGESAGPLRASGLRKERCGKRGIVAECAQRWRGGTFGERQSRVQMSRCLLEVKTRAKAFASFPCSCAVLVCVSGPLLDLGGHNGP